jgi:arylsulfatase A-like enzyme
MAPQLLKRRWPWLAAAALVLLALFASTVRLRIGGGDRDDRPRGGAEELATLASRGDVNLLFILVDTLRAERLSAYGYARETSPLFDLLATRGALFRHHLAQSSWTKSSMASLWTGLQPQRAGITRFDQVLSQDATLPAEILRAAGFRTAGLYRNGWVAPSFGFAQGFDVYDRPVSGRPPPGLRRENPTLSEGGSDDDLVDSAIEFLRVHGQERWFLYLHLMDLHEYTYDEESARFGSSYSDVYDNAILHENLVLDRLLGHLAEAGLLDRTLIAIASDHGEAFGERGHEGHARTVYREATEVPFILSFPFRLERPLVAETRTSNVDVFPTLLELLGVPPLPESDGRSRVPELLAAARGESPPAQAEPAFAFLDQHWGQRAAQPAPTLAVVDGGFRFVRTRGPQATLEQLFDARADAGEREDRIAAEPQVAERLRALADAELAREPAPFAAAPQTLELDELQLGQLRALGYAVP